MMSTVVAAAPAGVARIVGAPTTATRNATSNRTRLFTDFIPSLSGDTVSEVRLQRLRLCHSSLTECDGRGSEGPTGTAGDEPSRLTIPSAWEGQLPTMKPSISTRGRPAVPRTLIVIVRVAEVA